jgi:predicted MFS family arabinose efflux permease
VGKTIPYRLDALNFFLADVRGGLGAFVSVFLLTEANWTAAEIGAVLTVSGLIGISMHVPLGALIDATRAKRGLLVVSVALLAACAIAIERAPSGFVVLVADIIMAVLGGVFAPTVAALTLGLVKANQFASRLARNAVFDRTGNIFITAVVGLVGWWLTQRATFYLVPLFAVLAAFAVLSIPSAAIDHERARGFRDGGSSHRAESWWRLLRHHRMLLVLAATLAVFHFANASMLPLVGQKMALAHPGFETALLAAAILITQVVTIPVALLVGLKADAWGRRPLLVAACLALLLRGGIFAGFDSAPILLGAQILDGISTGILDVLIPLMLADLTVGTGRYSTSRGVIGTIQGVGGSTSNAAAGALVLWAGYAATFAVLAVVAFAAACLALAMRETRRAGAQGLS